MPSWALPSGEGLAPCINPYVWLYAHGARTSLDSGPGCPHCFALLRQQAQARIGFCVPRVVLMETNS